MKRYFLLVLFFVSACVPVPPQPTQTPYPTYTPYPTNTPYPTLTAVPPTSTLVPTPTSSSNPNGIIGVAKNSLGSIEHGGVIVEVYRMIIADVNSPSFKFAKEPAFKGAKTAVELVLKITNTTDTKKRFQINEGLAVANGEQISFQDYWGFYVKTMEASVMPSASIMPGLWFPLFNSEWEDVSQLRIDFDGAINEKNFRYTEDYSFTIDVNDWGFEAKQP